MSRRWLLGLLSLILAVSGVAFTREFQSPTAAPPGPDRIAPVVVDYISYEWYMATWSDQEMVCSIIVDHEGMPLPGEVYRDCGEEVYSEWIVQPPCGTKIKDTCDGYYAVFVRSTPAQKEIPMELAPASAWISLEGCEPVLSTSTNICESVPAIVISGIEPLPNETITSIGGTYDGRNFDCDNTNTCKIPVSETPKDGVNVEFWSYSTYGDSSEVFTARVRVQKMDEGDPDRLYWYADVLSSQWQGHNVATCSDAWNVFPPVGGPPVWLSTPKQSEDLSSDIPYTYLAYNLIMQGQVDARACPDGGVTAGSVNQCGLEASRPAVKAWQNQFDELILTTAQETGVPARLLKNLFARESQFWPGSFQNSDDAGLGQLTENGADTTLFWNTNFYEDFCPLVFEGDTCGAGYMHLEDDARTLLRHALVNSVNATCEECPLGLDLAQADYSVGVFAHSMIANCEQAGQVVKNYSLRSPGQVASFEDLWKFTLVNYNAGGGCLADAVSKAFGNNPVLTWENVSPFLTGACSGAVDYVNDISK